MEPEPISGIEGYKRHFAKLTTAFPDLRITQLEVLEAEEKAATERVDAASVTVADAEARLRVVYPAARDRVVPDVQSLYSKRRGEEPLGLRDDSYLLQEP